MKGMLKKRLIYFIFTLIFAIAISPWTPALAYSIGDYHWDTNYVTFDMSSLPTNWQYEVAYAAITWNGAPADFTFSSNSSSGNEVTQEYMADESGLAISSGTYYYGTNHFATCWTKFNTKYEFSTDGSHYDIQSCAAHEFGHWLELHDVYFWPWQSKVMYFALGEGSIRRVLQQDDIDGIVAIYGQ